MYKFLITKRSGNKKTGPIPVTSSPRNTCPKDCPLQGNGGCYGEQWPLNKLWSGLDDTQVGERFKHGKNGSVKVHSLFELVTFISTLALGQLWRHNQVGDLPGDGTTIDGAAVGEIVEANRGRKGFTYTHYNMGRWENREAVGYANRNGFCVNLSANSLTEADTLSLHTDSTGTRVGPVVSVVPSDQLENTKTPAGRKVVICPAATHDNISCATCKLCAKQHRDFIIGFPAHGSRKRTIDRRVAS